MPRLSTGFSCITRRAVVFGVGTLLAGCSVSDFDVIEQGRFGNSGFDSRYGEVVDGGFRIPAVDLAEIDQSLLRSVVQYNSPYRPGTIVVDVESRRLYLVLEKGSAIRYAVGVGREEALNFRGAAVIGRKSEWPTWTPTESMIHRIPKYARYAGGMPGGIGNPLGARALYLYRDGQDTYFRIHGTNEPESIGKAVSSGCIRMLNQDVIDLYTRVPMGAPVVVLQQSAKISG
ncbi:MAG TPA: L,D-transpeptidase [Pseudolabrys sp.]|nr:L,D-transpeptidase [Pseudolabrys sp.]